MLVHEDREKFGVDFLPDVIVNCHSNPLWAIQGPRDKWIQFLKDMRFIVCVDVVPNEMTDFADIILPSSDVLETWNNTMIEPPYTEGMCFRQPITPPLYDTKSEEDIFNELSERLGILDQYNEVINMVSGFHHKPELLLKPGIKYGDRDIAERKGLLWNDKPIEWYMEHGHASTERRLDKWYRPWEGMRLLFYIEDLPCQREQLRKKMTELRVPFIDEWPFEDYAPLPTTRLDTVHLEPEEYNMYAITFKDIQLNFGESLSNPWIKDIVYRDPVHTGLLMNAATAEKMGLKDWDIVKVESPYGKVYGRMRASQGIHPDTVGISNSLSRTKTENRFAAMAGGHFNDMLPYDMKHTDGASGQPETTCKVKVTKLDDWPDFLKEGGTVYDLVERLEHKKGKGAH
jgi:anaerobic selenocysteine-containing dehydrogenase